MTALDSPAVRTAVESLILARLAVPSSKPPAAADVRADVAKVTGSPLTAADFAEATARLQADGLVEPRPRSKGAVQLTNAGRAAALEYLGLTALPPGTNWPAVRTKYLFPKALGPGADAAKLDKPEKLGALLIRRKYDLPAGNTLGAVFEALVCKLIGRPEETTFRGLLCAVLSDELGSDSRLSKEDLLKQLPRRAAGTKTSRMDDLRAAVVREWLRGVPDRPAAAPVPVGEVITDPAPLDLPMFAATVRRIARDCPPDARFGANKAFVAAVWRAAQSEHSFPKMPLDAFKAALLDAARAGLLRLEPADMVQSMDAALVADSATAWAGATFHFILIEEPRP